jgi:hypothetical protein
MTGASFRCSAVEYPSAPGWVGARAQWQHMLADMRLPPGQWRKLFHHPVEKHFRFARGEAR